MRLLPRIAALALALTALSAVAEAGPLRAPVRRDPSFRQGLTPRQLREAQRSLQPLHPALEKLHSKLLPKRGAVAARRADLPSVPEARVRALRPAIWRFIGAAPGLRQAPELVELARLMKASDLNFEQLALVRLRDADMEGHLQPHYLAMSAMPKGPGALLHIVTESRDVPGRYTIVQSMDEQRPDVDAFADRLIVSPRRGAARAVTTADVREAARQLVNLARQAKRDAERVGGRPGRASLTELTQSFLLMD